LEIRNITVTRYVTPLREGGSLPAIVEADDQFLYVLKFRGAGQGTKALIAEFIGCEIARALGFRVPELVFAHLDSSFGRIEGDEEIQDLLKASVGLNLGVHFLSGAITFDPISTRIDSATASKIVWLDSFLMNVDRTARNTNMLLWHKELWLIDHGASLYFHHSWNEWQNGAKPFPKIKDHVMLPLADALDEANQQLKPLITEQLIREIVFAIPEDWLMNGSPFETAGEHRAAYVQFLNSRISQSDFFVNEAKDARKSII
jgi:hypothetical protein